MVNVLHSVHLIFRPMFTARIKMHSGHLSFFYLGNFCALKAETSHESLLIEEKCVDLRL